MIREDNRIIHYLIILIVCLFAFFVNNQVIPADLMESRNLATAQEMVHEKNYLTPTMNGELRLEKPPLPTWIAAGVEILKPESLITQRYMAGLSATLMVFFLFFIVSRLTRNNNVGLLSALVLATCFNVVLMGRTATWDIYCHSFMLGAIYFLILAFEKRGRQWKWFILSGLFMGLSFLSKGPVSFYALLLPFLVSYIVVFRPSARGKIIPLCSMIVVCLVVSFWWPLYIMEFHPEMGLAVADKESSSWLNHNVRPFYYYWQFPVEAGIWCLFWVTSLIWFFCKKDQRYRQVFKFSVIWTLAALILLSIIPEKKTRYLLPMLIPGAINIAIYFYESIRSLNNKGEKVVFKINSVLIGLVLLALPVALYIVFVKENLETMTMFIITSVISVALACLIFVSVFNRKGVRVVSVFTCIVLTMIMIEGLCMIPIGNMFINEDRHSIRMLRNNEEVKNLPFFYNQDEEIRMELVYEANRIIRPLDADNDSLILRNTPFVFVSGLPIDSLFKDKDVSIEHIDTFDNNWRKTDHKRHNKNLVREVAVIRRK
ncbi:MAG: ArnT family glycosyltransferase [Dysgonomonas sp.]